MTKLGDFDDLDSFFGRRPQAVLTPHALSPRPATATRQARPARAPSTRHAPHAPHAPRAPRAAKERPGPVDAFIIERRTRRRLVGFVAVVAVTAGGIGARLADIQVTSRQTWVTYGAKQRDGFRVIDAGRGAIYDRNGQAFALSVTEPNIVADPKQVRGPIATARKLAPILGVSESELTKKLTGTSRYQLLAKTVSAEVAKKVLGLKLAGITQEDAYVRKNPSGGLGRNVVGTTYADGGVDKDGHMARRGIERAYENSLEGTQGRLEFEKDPGGNTIAGGQTKLTAAKPGTNLYLTLDQSLQYATEQALIKQVTATRAKQAMAIISRPSTGEILSMATVAADGEGNVRTTGANRPVSDVFEPGSVNKMITVAGALEEGLIDPTTPHDVPDRLMVGDHLFTDHDPHPTQNWSTTDILANSSNIGTIKIAQQLGAPKVDQYLRAFGFGTSSGLPDEVNGIMLPLDAWSGTSIGAIPIGQGIGVTALQMLTAYNVIANDGIYVAPKLVAATDTGTGKTPTPASARRRVVSTETAISMRQMLAKVVSDGTGKPAQIPGYEPFGKTGTARIPQFAGDSKDAYKDAQGKYHYIGSFVGAVQGADLSIIVTVQEAETSIFGSDLAAPVFSALASLALRYQHIAPPNLLAAAKQVAAARAAVPELSQSALEADSEGPASGTETAPG